ncbi:MAG: phytoene/squalene synthase family protein [Lewinellaceae bacterium]|nr:phytoene/squalene synthase family protein [Saprospiraceae bacterium]MCB9313548.1 phytoene/squalene synthase family protein [Lewinellaceae bacterium]HRW74979.1 phytoene/squalene synthase family protein [Saprospiraceae bacterium]
MKALYDQTCRECASLITRRYSTSFSMGIRAFGRSLRPPIYAIYGYVRFADEIVDTFHDQDQAALLERFRTETWQAIDEGISLNPVLHAFQEVVNTYHMDRHLIDAFLDSMAMDLDQDRHGRKSFNEYIYGSAEVVGLMCLTVFVGGDSAEYARLAPAARRLGAAFQKVNFLRDMQSDFEERGRIYFPGVDFTKFSQSDKERIEQEVEEDFQAALEGILQLPDAARFGVFLAYRFYTKLFEKIRKSSPEQVKSHRIRVPNWRKAMLVCGTFVQSRFRLI